MKWLLLLGCLLAWGCFYPPAYGYLPPPLPYHSGAVLAPNGLYLYQVQTTPYGTTGMVLGPQGGTYLFSGN